MSDHYKRQNRIINRKKEALLSIYSKARCYKLPHSEIIKLKTEWIESFPSDSTSITREYLRGFSDALFGALLHSLEWGFMTSDGWKTRYQDIPESDLDDKGMPLQSGYHAYPGTEGKRKF